MLGRSELFLVDVAAVGDHPSLAGQRRQCVHVAHSSEIDDEHRAGVGRGEGGNGAHESDTVNGPRDLRPVHQIDTQCDDVTMLAAGHVGEGSDGFGFKPVALPVEGADTVQQVTDALLAGMHEGRFLISLTPETTDLLRDFAETLEP